MVIVIQCPDRLGLVASISGLLAARGCNIISMHEHVDREAGMFFMRLEIEDQAGDGQLSELLTAALPTGSVVRVQADPEKKAVVLVTREHHCLADILVRNHFRTLGAQVQCVIGNYPVLGDICKRFDVPFFLVEYANQGNPESILLDILSRYSFDYIVLAKFMRVLSPGFVSRFPNRIINIHHSFLPAFAGASPYRQAFDRGVKLIGATAHFVTNELDEGPIVAQQIIPADHSLTADDMKRAGSEIEAAVLARALRLVFDDRVFVYKNKTVVFE